MSCRISPRFFPYRFQHMARKSSWRLMCYNINYRWIAYECIWRRFHIFIFILSQLIKFIQSISSYNTQVSVCINQQDNLILWCKLFSPKSKFIYLLLLRCWILIHLQSQWQVGWQGWRTGQQLSTCEVSASCEVIANHHTRQHFY